MARLPSWWRSTRGARHAWPSPPRRMPACASTSPPSAAPPGAPARGDGRRRVALARGRCCVVALLAGLATAGAARVEALDARGGDRAGSRRARPPPCSRSRSLTGALVRRMVRCRDRSWPRCSRPESLAGARAPRPSRAALARAALLVAALAFGAGARWLFAPSAGSWDMEYWRAWTESAIARGVTGAYGPPLPPGAFVPDAARRTEPLWMVTHDGRRFPIDYPPLALAAWRAAAALVPAGTRPRGTSR